MHYVQKGVGHYGVFNGSRFKSEIVPRISDFMRVGGEYEACIGRSGGISVDPNSSRMLEIEIVDADSMGR